MIVRGQTRFVILGWLVITLSLVLADISLTSLPAVMLDLLWLALTILLVGTAPRD